MNRDVEAAGHRAGEVTSPGPAPSTVAPPSRPQRWLREPLLHFLLAGLALFVLYRALNPGSVERDSSNVIRLTEDDLVQMTILWRAQGRPPPTPEQIKSLVETKVREEVLFREALALGLDKNDTIVKRRMAQKMEFLAEDLSGIGDPKPDELRAWFAANADRFAFPPRASFRHLYFSPDRRGERAQADASRALEKLGGKPADSTTTAKLADPFMFQDYHADRSIDQVASVFGPQFAQALLQLTPGSWQGPVESGYGWHLVWIEAMTPKRIPTFEEVEPEVKQLWLAERRAETKRKAFEAMRSRYEVVLPDSLTKDKNTGQPGKRP
jgi:hypothetical protein